MTKIQKLKDIASVLKYIRGKKSFDRVIEKVNVISIGDGKCSVELKLEDEHVDKTGKMHIGLSSTLVDCISGYALMSHIDGAHVTVDLALNNIDYPKKGDEIIIEGYVNHFEKNMAFLEAKFKNKATGEVLLKATHTKFIVN